MSKPIGNPIFSLMDKHISIKNLAVDDRPREKLMQHGYAALSNSEILGILIGSGTKDKSAVKVCQEILSSVNGDLNRLAKLSIKDLQKFKGIGEAKAISIVAALELGRRRKDFASKAKTVVKSSSDAFGYISHIFKDLNHEEFHILLLNRANTIKSSALISKGGLSGTVADGKLIFKKALEELASAIILCHNHPSGNLKPSKADIQLTKKLKEFGAMIDLPVLDHIIFTDNDYFSFADEGIL
ncbi:MAG: DNA repair protein RadC [Crocinitomicaceae bacterium]